MKNLSPKEAITILEGMRTNTPLPKAAVMQSKRNAAIDMAIDTLKYSEMPNSSDSISRQAAIGVIKRRLEEPAYQHAGEDWYVGMNDAESELLDLPSAQPDCKPINYQDCANAMLKMWMDNVVTDGEYNRIMDKLNAHWMSQVGKDE